MKKELLERGWCQGQFGNQEGQVCLMGSLTRNKSIPFEEIDSNAVVAAFHAVLNGGVVAFNDTQGRTFNEIMDLLDQAIYNEKEKGIIK